MIAQAMPTIMAMPREYSASLGTLGTTKWVMAIMLSAPVNTATAGPTDRAGPAATIWLAHR